MSNQLLTLLRNRRAELDLIESSMKTCNQITKWHVRTRPLIVEYFEKHLDEFDKAIKIQSPLSPVVGRIGQKPVENPQRDMEKRALNDAKVKNVKGKLLCIIDALIELWGLDVGNADTQETDSVFAEIDRLIADSLISPEFKNVVAGDLKDAQRAYHGGSFKGCVVILGAALEGLMLGTLQRTEVLNFLAAHSEPPGPIKDLGKCDPQLAGKIGDKLNFEDYKVCIHNLIPESKTFPVEDIQSFRNAIHPWESIKNSQIYETFQRYHVLRFVGALQQIVEILCKWTPPSEG